MTSGLVEIDEISKVFERRGVHALDRASLRLEPGSFTSIIGPSGCGKSTLLKIIAGLLDPSGGCVRIDDNAVVGPRPEVGLMFQEATLLPWRTALENVLLPLQVRDGRKGAKAEIDDARQLLDVVGLGSFEQAYPGELSGGMAQRVAICRMLITKPTVLLLDEPFGALDELTRGLMNDELQEVCRRHDVTSFMVTHSIAEAVYLSDRVVVMSARPGRIAAEVHIDLPRPRTFDLTATQRFGELCVDIRNHLDLGAHV